MSSPSLMMVVEGLEKEVVREYNPGQLPSEQPSVCTQASSWCKHMLKGHGPALTVAEPLAEIV